jgi:hypothetical protein
MTISTVIEKSEKKTHVRTRPTREDNITMTFRETVGGRVRTRFIWPRTAESGGNETLDLLRGGKFLDQLSECYFLNKDIVCYELANVSPV